MPKKSPTKQKPRPSREVLEMVKAARARMQCRRNEGKIEDSSQAAARMVREATEKD
jgi:hypothetical protein